MFKVIFRTKEQHIKTGDELVGLVSLERLSAFISAIIAILATALVLIPRYVLY